MGLLDDSSELEAAWTELAERGPDASKGSHLADASRRLAAVFDLFPGLQLAKRDMTKNADCIQCRVGEQTLGDAIRDHGARLSTASPRQKRAAVNTSGDPLTAIHWVLLTIGFVTRLLRELAVERDKTLSACVGRAYETTLAPHHGALTRRIFATALSFAPARAAFEARLSARGNDILYPRLAALLPGLEIFVGALNRAMAETIGTASLVHWPSADQILLAPERS